MTAKVLVVGGAGYIGSHMVKALARAGHAVTTFDNLSTGHRSAVRYGAFIHGDLQDRDSLARALGGGRFDLVMHFAASAYVGESVTDPRKYYANNVVGALNLLHAMIDAGVKRLIFSSSCATYGVPHETPITESHPQTPINPYGRTKLIIEDALRDYGPAYGFASASLRYFNAAGADPEGELSERHDPETHLIPLVLREAARVLNGGDREKTALAVFGDDYPTADGTCVRDYIHVEDLCMAHLAAAERILSGKAAGFNAWNLGTETGASVLEIISSVRKITGADLIYHTHPRRPGDPPALIGAATKAREELGWSPRWTHLDDVIASAWKSFPRT